MLSRTRKRAQREVEKGVEVKEQQEKGGKRGIPRIWPRTRLNRGEPRALRLEEETRGGEDDDVYRK
jgi:hypothetical protein